MVLLINFIFKASIRLNSVKTKISQNGEGKRRNEFAEWHNYAKYDLLGE